MKRLFGDNPLLAISIALPLLVVLLFAAATVVPKLLTDPPSHDLLLVIDHGGAARPLPVTIRIVVEGGKVVARAGKPGQYEQGYAPRLFRYHPASDSVTEVALALPQAMDALSDGDLIRIPDLDGVEVSTDSRAPDGYEYRGYDSGRGLFAEIFGSSRRGDRLSVAKDGAVYRIRLPEDGYWYYGARFLGWVVNGDAGS